MDPQFILNREQVFTRLQELGIAYEVQEHQPVMTMQELIAATKITEQTALIKNLFYVDKKDNFYYVLAHNDTNIGKAFWKSMGLSAGNMRFSKPEQLDVIKSQKGALNPFSLFNDKEDKVKKVIIDNRLLEFVVWGLHPADNTATVFVQREVFREKFLNTLKKDIVTVSLADEAPKEQVEAPKIVQQDVQQLSVTVKKSENFSKWYQQVITKSEMIEYYEVSGCYILRPWAYSIWDSIQKYFDNLITEVGVENAYFPMFVSERALNKEKDHVEGFAPEVAWVTKYGNSDLKEKIAIRPTSETIMYPAYAKWIKGHRDLPLKLNQWTNIVRWEFKFPTPFIRTREFLWQEGHTAHSNEKQATEQVYQILDFYAQVYEDLLAIPVIKGTKTESEKFAGGYFTTSIETIIPQNGRGVQAATSHQLGQNFSKMFDIIFEDEKKEKQYAWQTSWGLTTRSIGCLIMFHGDDQGLVLPPKVSKYQVVIVPITFKGNEENIIQAAKQLEIILRKGGIRVHADIRDNYNPGWKYNHWEQKGVPIRFELGPKDIEKNEVRIVQRFDGNKFQLNQENIVEQTKALLETIQNKMFQKAKAQLDGRIKRAQTWQQFMNELNQQNTVLTLWCQNQECEKQVKTKSGVESKEQDVVEDGQVQLTGAAKTLCMPLTQDPIQEGELCFACGNQAKKYVLWGRTY